jgi:ferrous iron transport protein B
MRSRLWVSALLLAALLALGGAVALLIFFAFAMQCMSTIAVVRRETNSWRYPLYMAAYLFALAYAGAFVTYRVALALGAGHLT